MLLVEPSWVRILLAAPSRRGTDFSPEPSGWLDLIPRVIKSAGAVFSCINIRSWPF
jgi:hypothetical protein